MNATSAAVTTFRREWTRRDPTDLPLDDWDARRGLYALHWSFFANDVYQDVNRLAQPYKAARGLYRHTRGCYNPAARIAGFFRSHIWGGSLDPDAGDGKATPSALPIAGASQALRAAIARLWWDSDWQVRKDVATLWGTVCGDVALSVCDEPDAGLVSLEVVHAGTIRWVERNARGEVIAYRREEPRPDPRTPPPSGVRSVAPARNVAYVEDARLDGDVVQFATYLDGIPFDWRSGDDGRPRGTGRGAEPVWEAPYGFVPLWLVKHIDAGLPWGLSEFDAGRDKFDEVNDLGSKLHDQIRRAVEGAWLMAGVKDPSAIPRAPRTPATADKPQPGREELKAIYDAPPDARPWSLVGDLDIAHVSAELRQALDNLEDDYPELRFERLRTGGQVSGEALRVARQPAAARVEERRPAYDQALACAQMGAVAIGGWRGYKGYRGFGLDSYDAATPNHRIDRRPVFAVEPADALAEKQAKYLALKAATDAGLPRPIAMRELGYSEADIAEAERLAEESEAAAFERQKQLKVGPPAAADD